MSDIEIINILNSFSYFSSESENEKALENKFQDKPLEITAIPQIPPAVKRQSVAFRLSSWFGCQKASNNEVLNTCKKTIINSNNEDKEISKVEELTKNLSCLLEISSTNNLKNLNKFQQSLGTDSVREVLFYPNWSSKISRLQNSVLILRQFSGFIIIRCYLNKEQNSHFYMQQVHLLINVVLVQLRFPILPLSYITFDSEMRRPVFRDSGLLKWDNGLVFIRVNLLNDYNASCFKAAFNERAFNRGGIFRNHNCKPPFAHFDLTRPERDLRNALNKFCNNLNMNQQFEMQGNAYSFAMVSKITYFHNGVQLFKKFMGNNDIVPLQLEENTEIQHLHSVVITLRKYAKLYMEKKFFVILHNISNQNFQKVTNVVDATFAFLKIKQKNSTQIVKVSRNFSESSKNPELVRVILENSQNQIPFIAAFHRNLQDYKVSFLDLENFQRINAARDLTPPELALCYHLRDYCRDKNAQQRHNHIDDYYYAYNFRIYERKKNRTHM